MIKRLIIASIVGVSMMGEAVGESPEVREKKKDLNKIQEELQKKKKEKEVLAKEAESLSKTLDEIRNNIQQTENTLLNTKKKSMDVEENLARVKIKRDQIQTEEDRLTHLSRSALRNYVVYASLSGPQSISAAGAQILFRNLQARRSRAVQIKNEYATSFQNLILTHESLMKEMKNQEIQIMGLRSQIGEKEKILEKKKTREQIVEAEMKDLEKTAEELTALIEVLSLKESKERERQKKERLDKLASGQSPIPPRSLMRPIQGPITTYFGKQYYKDTSLSFKSNGIVIKPHQEGPVLSVGDGQVIFAGQFMSYGNMVIVEHPGDWVSVYGRLARWVVEKGQFIRRGDSVGLCGVNSLGQYETYFEVRFYGKPVDPLPWFVD